MNQGLEGIQEIQKIRSNAVNHALLAFSVLLIPALIASLARTTSIGWQNIFYFHIVLSLMVWVTAALRNRLSYQIRTFIVLAILLGIGITGLLNFGMVGNSALVLMTFCILTTSLYGIRGAVASLTLCAGVFAAVGWGVQTGAVVSVVDANVYQVAATSWILMAVSFVFFTGLGSSMAGIINSKLISSINDLSEKTTELMEVNKRLETEVSVRLQKEEELAASQKLLQTVFDAIPHVIFVKDLKGRYLKVNSAYAEKFNLADKDIEGRTLGQFGVATEEEVRVQIALDQEVIKTGEKVESKANPFTFRGDDKRWVNVSRVPLRGEDGSVVGLVGISEDITESRRIEEQLMQAQKMEAVGQLAGGVAHDFNNMLQIIGGYTQLALSRDGTSDEIAKDLQKVLKGTESAAALTRQLLVFSRQNQLSLRDLDIKDLIDNLMRMMDRLLGVDLELQVITDDGLGNVHGDPGMIEQVLMNLCVNARDAMPTGGQLVIEARNFAVDEAQCKAEGWETPGSYVLISVADNGNGIAEEALPKIFDPFFTTKEAEKGTGLGLSVVHGIVKHHHGRITVYSELGQGTTFNIFLPVAKKSETRLAEQKALPITGGTETILVADDEADILQLTTELLEDKGYTVLAASDGEEAVSIFNDHPGEIALALLDLSMPKLNGRGVYDEIHPRNPQLPFIFDSGFSANIMDREFFESTHVTLMQKPFSPSTLLYAVREALDQA